MDIVVPDKPVTPRGPASGARSVRHAGTGILDLRRSVGEWQTRIGAIENLLAATQSRPGDGDPERWLRSSRHCCSSRPCSPGAWGVHRGVHCGVPPPVARHLYPGDRSLEEGCPCPAVSSATPGTTTNRSSSGYTLLAAERADLLILTGCTAADAVSSAVHMCHEE
jgi:hypothetical protein